MNRSRDWLSQALRDLEHARKSMRLRDYEWAAELDKHYVISRYPNGFAEGAPWEHYTRRDAEKCVRSGERLVGWAKDIIEGKQGGGRQKA